MGSGCVVAQNRSTNAEDGKGEVVTMSHENIKDFSCVIQRPIDYLELIHDHFTTLSNRDEYDRITLNSLNVNAFTWMIQDAIEVIKDTQEELYPTTK